MVAKKIKPEKLQAPTRIGSAKAIFKGALPETAEVKEEYQSNAEEVLETEVVMISDEELNNAIQAFSHQLQQEGKKSSAAMLKVNRTIFSNGGVVVELSKHEIKTFEEIRTDLVVYLRNTFNMPALKLSYDEVVINDRPVKAFTSKDKLAAMMLKNPSVNDLLNTFDLEIDD